MVVFLNIFITLAQLIVGLLTGSLALLSDALHNLSDVVAILISWIASIFVRRGASYKHTFGFQRAEIMAAWFNGITLIILSFFIFFEAIDRFNNPVKIESKWVIILALLSIFINLLSAYILKPKSQKNLNMKSVYLHLLSDVFTSVLVLLGGLIIYFKSYYWIDLVLSQVIVAYLFVSAFFLLFEVFKVLMLFTPAGFDLDEIAQEVKKQEEVKAIHHLHLWLPNEKEFILRLI